jgi:hypothetical protein
MRNTDYYIKSEYASVAQKAIDNFIQQQAAKRETNIDAHISDVTPASFRTQTAAILDARARADIARIVNQNGGVFNTDKTGLSHWGVEDSLQTNGSKGRPVNLSASLSRRVSSANRQHRMKWEDLMAAATGQRMEYREFSEEERDTMARGAKPIVERRRKIHNPELVKADISTKTELSTLEREEKDKLIYSRPDLLPQNYIASTAQGRYDLKRIRQREQQNLYTPEDERADTYARLAQAGRRFANQRQYEIDNPDDPLVRDRQLTKSKLEAKKEALDKKRKASNRRVALNKFKTRATDLIFRAVKETVQMLGKLYTSVQEIGRTIQKQATDAMKYNLPYEQMKELQRFASARPGLDADIFSKIFGKTVGDFSNAANLNTGSIDYLAPYLRMDTAKLVGFVTRNTDTPDAIAYTILDTFMKNTAGGLGGVISGMETDEAFMTNYNILSAYNQSFADLFASWYDWATATENIGKGGGLANAAQGGIKEWIRMAMPAAAIATGIATPVDSVAARQTNREWTEFKTIIGSIKDDILTKILSHLSEVVVWLRNMARKILGEWFPEYDAAENAYAVASNEEAKSRITSLMGTMTPGITAVANRYGFTGDDAAQQFTARMSAVAKGDLGKLPVGMTMDEFYRTYDEYARYIVMQEKLNELEKATITDERDKNYGKTYLVGGVTNEQLMSRADTGFIVAMHDTNRAAVRADEYDDSLWVRNNVDYANITSLLHAQENAQRHARLILAEKRSTRNAEVWDRTQAEKPDVDRTVQILTQLKSVMNNGDVSLADAVRALGFSSAENNWIWERLLNISSHNRDDMEKVYEAFIANSMPVTGIEGMQYRTGISVARRQDVGYGTDIANIYSTLLMNMRMSLEDIFSQFQVTAQMEDAQDRTITIQLVDPEGNKHSFEVTNTGGHYFSGNVRLYGRELDPSGFLESASRQ